MLNKETNEGRRGVGRLTATLVIIIDYLTLSTWEYLNLVLTLDGFST